MVHAFISSQALRAGRTGVSGLTASVVAHTTLIAAAVLGTAGHDLAVAARPAAVAERVVFVTREMLDRARSATRTAAATRAARTTVRTERAPAIDLASLPIPDVADLVIPDVAVPLPSLDLAARASDGIEFTGADSRQLLRAAQGHDRVAYAGDGLYTEDMVELVASARLGNPVPRYPYSLQSDGIQDSFIVRFVVDTTGHVQAGTLKFPKHAHRLFIASVRDALLRSRFFPAEVGGRRVAQLVQQQFSFVMAR